MAYINERYIPQKEPNEREQRLLQLQAQLLQNKKALPDTSHFRRRAGYIDQAGTDALNYEVMRRNKREQKALEEARRKAEMETARRIAISVGQGQGPNLRGRYTGSTGSRDVNVPGAGGSFLNFINAIAEHESGGRYGARNRDSGAMGKYQIMPGNIRGSKRGWDYEALGYDVSESQFMSSPQIQEAIARHRLKQYYNQYGPRGAAIAWYAGPGALKYSPGALNRKQGNYSSINGYAQAILRRLGL